MITKTYLVLLFLLKSYRQEGVDLERQPQNKKLTVGHECTTCARTFSRPDKLRWHALVHTNERRYKCSKCDKAFKRPWDLKRHGKRIHQRRGAQRSFK